MVDMYSAFTANPDYKTALLFDGLHPTDAGYALMVQTWYHAISGVLHGAAPVRGRERAMPQPSRRPRRAR